MKRSLRPMALLCLAAAAAPVHANVVFSDDFDTDHSANWSFASSLGSADGANDGIGSDGNAFFDYGALVPPAPGGTTTKGMKIVANLPGTGIFSGVTMSLNSQSFDFANTPYKITAQVWLNYYGGTTSGTTEEVMMGVGAAAGSDQFVGTGFNSVGFATSTDGDTSTDWRVYKTPWPANSDTDPTPAPGKVQQGPSGVYAAGTPTDNSVLNSSDPYYVGHFPGGEVPPDLQKNVYSNQQPSSLGMPASPGTVAFAWHRWTIVTSPNGGPISYYVSDASDNDVLIATIQGGTTNPYTLNGGSVYFNMFDINTSSPPTGFDAETLLFGLIDNVKVEDISAPPHFPGDTNNDGVVDLVDLNNVLNNFGATGTNAGDDNSDGVVDLVDLNNVLNNFGATHAASALSVVPEPASLGLVGLGAAALLGRRRARRSR